VIVAQLVPSPGAMLAVWLAGGALALAGAMAYAELAAVRPHAGGEYVYLRDAFGPLAAFLTGWTSFIAGFSGAIAASTLALADYVTRFVPGAARAKPLIALAAIAALTLVHVRGLDRASRAEPARRPQGRRHRRDRRARVRVRPRRRVDHRPRRAAWPAAVAARARAR
jgi:APA family basic amino acid/polyamine antiporter